MDDWLKFVREVGFPTGVAFYVLVRIEPAVRELTRAIARLELTIITRSSHNQPPPPGL